VRRALERLAVEGLVETSTGRGRYVRTQPLAEPPNALMSFTELGRARGLVASAIVLAERVRSATLEEAELFGVAPGADVFELERLRLLDGLSVALDRARVPLAVAPVLTETDFSVASLYETLDRAGAGVVAADFKAEAVAADERQAERLGIAPGDPLLLGITNGFDAAGRLVELGETVYRGDRYRFRANLVRGPRSEGGIV
jgi:GntR family transcriptional regulator